MAAHHRHVAGVVADAVLLLVGGVVLLIDDNQAKIGVGQEQRRAGADHDRNLAVGDGPPGARAPARRELRMPFRRPHAEAGGEAVEELGGQRDLRHQDQALPAASDHIRHRLEIDLGLARAGDTVDERNRIAALGDRGLEFGRGRALVLGQIRLREIGIGRFRDRLRRQHHRFQRALVDQAVDHAAADAGFAGGIAFAAQHFVCKKRQHPLPGRGHALRRRANKAHADPFALGAKMLAHAQAHPQHHAARGDRVIGDPVDEVAQLGLERRQFELFLDVLEPVVEPRIGLRVLRPDHGGGLAGAERHAHDIARRQLQRLGHPVGIRPVKRDRDQDIDDTARIMMQVVADSRGFRKGKGWPPLSCPH